VTFKGRPIAITTQEEWSKSQFVFSPATNSWMAVLDYTNGDKLAGKEQGEKLVNELRE
jgi:hypothetical protein